MHTDYCSSKCSHLQFFSEIVNAIGLQGEKLHLDLHSTLISYDIVLIENISAEVSVLIGIKP